MIKKRRLKHGRSIPYTHRLTLNMNRCAFGGLCRGSEVIWMIIRGSGRIGLPQQIKEAGNIETGSIHQPQRWHISHFSSALRPDGWLRYRHEDIRGAVITSVTLQPSAGAAAHQNQWLHTAKEREKLDTRAARVTLACQELTPKSCSRCCL